MRGVWVAYSDDKIAVCSAEKDALRAAMANGLKVGWLEFGKVVDLELLTLPEHAPEVPKVESTTSDEPKAKK